MILKKKKIFHFFYLPVILLIYYKKMYCTAENRMLHCQKVADCVLPYILLCRLPILAEATYRDHFCRLASSMSSASVSQKISVTFFFGTTQASFLIFGKEHQYGELYCVTHFWICGMSISCFTRLWILWT